jgi:uncharacterized membrane protein
MDKSSSAKKCVNCENLKDCQDSASSWFFLFTGLIATIAVRVVNIAMDFSPFWAKVAWYIGILGFLVYFLYKYRQHRATRRVLVKSDIIQKLEKDSPLSLEESKFLSSILCGLRSRKDSTNYFFIFFTSALALLLGIYQDFLR